jgi:hypothetical protein
MAKGNNIGKPSIEYMERHLVETALVCSRTVSELKTAGIVQKTKFFETASHYTLGLTKLFEAITGVRFDGKFQSDVPTVKDFRGNRYAYFGKVLTMLNEHDELQSESMQMLNESIVNFGEKTNRYDFQAFKDELADCIKELESVDDFARLDTVPQEIMKIKLLARKPMYVYGFDVVNSPVLRQELKEKMRIDIEQAFAILWDRTNKQLLFPFKSRLIAYDVAGNRLGDFNEVNADRVADDFTGEKLQVRSVTKMDLANYKDIIAHENNGNFVTLWTNVPMLGFKYTDNLYGDAARAEWLKKNGVLKGGNMLVKS